MSNDSNYDYIVVGSGAGGGPLAANLARAGFRVLLLEAGADHGDRPSYRVPAFHGQATEDHNMEWDYFVRHYQDDDRQRSDSKFDSQHQGIWYPRAGTLGGCTAHNAMITVYPHNCDWDQIAQLTGDGSWNSASMRTYFERLERCEYVKPPAAGVDPTRHGFDGWLTTSKADARLAAGDLELLKIVAAAALAALFHHVKDPRALAARLADKMELFPDRPRNILQLLRQEPIDPAAIARAVADQALDFLGRLLDPNDWQFVKDKLEGLCIVPLAVKGGEHEPLRRGWRNGPREYIVATQQELAARKDFAGKLDIWTNVLVTRVLLQAGDVGPAAIGVAYVSGPHLYEADPNAATAGRSPWEDFKKQERVELAGREVILSAGAFNSPQLLMLSGIGPKEEIESFKDSNGQPLITCRVNLPGVGTNLQDRYEVGVISQLKKEFTLLEGAAFQAPEPGDPYNEALKTDPALRQWAETGTGLYATNGAVLGIILKSQQEKEEPDLFIFGLPGYFKGYFQHYSAQFEARKDRFTWAILKAHTQNTGGYVRLRSADPRDVPVINFKYFEEGTDEHGQDLDSVVAGVKFVRQIMNHPLLSGLVTKNELLPGKEIGTDEAIAEFIQSEAWGHHACGTCKIGADNDPDAVLDSRFRVRGVQNLRVVDASVFPRIPGFFIVTPIYMISEKASDVILGRG